MSKTHAAPERTPAAVSTHAARSWARLDGVDILRGLAIFFVLMNHVNMRLFLAKIHAIALGCLTAIASSRLSLARTLVRVLGGLGTVLILFILGLSNQARAWGLERSGLDMTILAVGSCMVIAAAAHTQWQRPRVMLPLVTLGRRSYEVYLTHMFVVFTLFGLFKSAGLPLGAVPVLFISVILICGLLGELVARFYSEPMNRRIRQRFGDGPEKFGSVIQT